MARAVSSTVEGTEAAPPQPPSGFCADKTQRTPRCRASSQASRSPPSIDTTSPDRKTRVVPYSGLYLLHAGEHVSPSPGQGEIGPPIVEDGGEIGPPVVEYGPGEEPEPTTTVVPVTLQIMGPVTIRRKKDLIDFQEMFRRELQNATTQRIIGRIANEQVGEEQKKRDRLQGGF